MGWLWSSSPGDAASKPDTPTNAPEAARSSGAALTDEQRMRIFGRPGPVSAPASASDSSSDSTREQKADAELDALIQSFTEADPGFKQSEKVDSQGNKVPIEDPTHYDRILPDGSLDISPEAIYPRTMSCRAAFDQAFYCQSVGGKFNDIYRYGQLRQCSEQWAAFWFCMRTRTLPDKQKAVHIKDHYMQRDEERRKKFGNSEDVWEIRKTAVTRAFERDPDADEAAQDLIAGVKE